MDKVTWWKNFKMGRELDLSGTFIYDGLQCFHQMEVFRSKEELFRFMYNISVGIERLLKVCVVLVEHCDGIDEAQFERSLKTHKHTKLLRRIKKKHPIEMFEVHNDFIELIEQFYFSYRYDNFSLKGMNVEVNQRVQVSEFIEKNTGIRIPEDKFFNPAMNSGPIRKFIGNTVGAIVGQLYDIVQSEAYRLNIYTYEIDPYSKAAKIFLFKEYDFANDEKVWKELLIYFMNSPDRGGLIDHLRSIKPLDFDPAEANDYLQCFRSHNNKIGVMGTIDVLYEDLEDSSEREEMLSVIGDPSVYIDWGDDEEEDEDEDI